MVENKVMEFILNKNYYHVHFSNVRRFEEVRQLVAKDFKQAPEYKSGAWRLRDFDTAWWKMLKGNLL